ncbi:hypothetical protein [uncultured Sphingomonas sp.]|uniref:hypothetical protein n=1 Tax=uncultured Sphingomonas sp. TaxID=158754 RepID=UPI0035C9438B
MKRPLLLAIGLLPLAACSRSPEATAVQVNADMLADDLEAQADNMEALAEDAANADAAAAIEGASANLAAEADNVRDVAEDAAQNL